ncbi:MAG TPA: Rieske 2Fe-2S domain-containing protein [Bryobacteraceae bacterium]|nr:Rieske 2Fe-2S domain-containing protein [Bryobacteraceae bacterium]
MPFVKVGSAEGLEADSVIEVLVGETPYAICNVGGSITALHGVCPHRGGPLGQGAIHGKNLVCPWHAWEWDCATGENDMNPASKVATCQVKIDNGDIFLDLPA